MAAQKPLSVTLQEMRFDARCTVLEILDLPDVKGQIAEYQKKSQKFVFGVEEGPNTLAGCVKGNEIEVRFQRIQEDESAESISIKGQIFDLADKFTKNTSFIVADLGKAERGQTEPQLVDDDDRYGRIMAGLNDLAGQVKGKMIFIAFEVS